MQGSSTPDYFGPTATKPAPDGPAPVTPAPVTPAPVTHAPITPVPRHPILGPVVAGAIGLGTCIAFGVINPAGGPVLCPFRAATGLYCPGCGSTRMMHQLMTGDIGYAFRLNPLAFVFVPLVAWWLFAGLTAMVGGPRWATPRFTARQTWILAGVVLAYWVLRNVPVFPFSLMGPT